MIKKEIYKLLNDQWNREISVAYLYFEKAAIVKEIGMKNYFNFLKKSAEEELEHAKRFYDYMLSCGVLPKVNDYIKTNVLGTSSVFDTTKYLLEIEIMTTKHINEIAKKALELNDFATFEFIQWFIKEQIEEEGKFLEIIQLSKLTQSDSDLDDKIASLI